VASRRISKAARLCFALNRAAILIGIYRGWRQRRNKEPLKSQNRRVIDDFKQSE
jgi:hypothetical protein